MDRFDLNVGLKHLHQVVHLIMNEMAQQYTDSTKNIETIQYTFLEFMFIT